MKFVLSFSTGKDCMNSLHRMVQAGHEPLYLMVMYNEEGGRSWFHGAEGALLEALSDSLGIPLLRCNTAGEDYHLSMERCLRQAKQHGAEACVFGDIDIEQHRRWNEARCEAAGIKAIMPLWEEDRDKLVHEVVDYGYKCLIKCLHPEQLPERFLGKIIDNELLAEMKNFNIDLCGENGEYHTIVVDGPLFSYPIPYKLGAIRKLEYVTAIEVSV